MAAADSARKQGEGESEAVEEVVITGTLVRGIAPAGTDVIGVTQQQVQQVGVSKQF